MPESILCKSCDNRKCRCRSCKRGTETIKACDCDWKYDMTECSEYITKKK